MATDSDWIRLCPEFFTGGHSSSNSLSLGHVSQESQPQRKSPQILNFEFSSAVFHGFIKIVSRKICKHLSIAINNYRQYDKTVIVLLIFFCVVWQHFFFLSAFISNFHQTCLIKLLLKVIYQQLYQFFSTNPQSERNCLHTEPFSTLLYIHRLCVTQGRCLETSILQD